MKYWADKFKDTQDNKKDVKAGIVAANNHYAGFGAATANMFRVMSRLAPVEWGMQKEIDYSVATELNIPEKSGYQKSKQNTLFDYIGR
jgi:hypothetical protein